MWMDLARYADSAGYADDPPRTIWAYRDYVIRAFNANKPLDRFTIEQLAGDLLENPTAEQLIATAFHRNTQTNSEGGTDDEEFRNAAVVDRVNTTMTTWMGTTMACAQCHTHKYDPLTQEEYFGMFAISGLAITLFLGGWNAPFSFLTWVPSYVWFFAKLIALIFRFIWVRGTVPRLRMDQLMNFAWKFMLPMTLINIGVAAVWHYMAGGWVRWIVCSLLVAGPYFMLGRGLTEAKRISKRTYRYAG